MVLLALRRALFALLTLLPFTVMVPGPNSSGQRLLGARERERNRLDARRERDSYPGAGSWSKP